MLCLFDLDGTLIDSELGITTCVKHALAQFEIPAPPPEQLRRWIGPPLRHSFAPLLEGDAEKVERAVEHYHERFNTLGWREHEIYPRIASLIGQLHAAGHQLAVVTSKPLLHAEPIINHLPFGALFQRVYGPSPQSAHSEKASMIAQALLDFGTPASSTVMIGDRHFDIEGALANHVRGIGVLWGFGDREELENAGADALAESPDALARLLAA